MSDDGVFNAAVAAGYDAIHTHSGKAEQALTTRVLKELAHDGTALEFAIGTGRIAVPLHDLGVTVKGIELSQAMVDELKKKPQGQDIEVLIGDMTTTRFDETFSLVFLVYNTIDNLTSQDAQVACFANAAAHLDPGGRFVVETLVPPLQKLTFGETKRAFSRSDEHWGMDEFDVVTQTYTSHHLHMQNGNCDRLSVPFRYAWPAEQDLMARMAGMTLEHRWSDWEKSAFTKTSERHVSVWRKSA